MNARDKFSVGDRVLPSYKALREEEKAGSSGSARMKILTGRVVGFGRHPEMVRVVQDGYKTPINFHESWFVVDERY